MPVVTIEIWEGRTGEEKEKLIKNMTNAVSESLNIPEKAVHIIIHEMPMQNWGIGGKQASKMDFEIK